MPACDMRQGRPTGWEWRIERWPSRGGAPFPFRRQTRMRAQDIHAEARLGGDPAAERDRLRAVPTFADFPEGRYLPYAKDRLRSYRDHESFFRLRLKDRWGSRRLDEVKPHDLAALKDALRADGLSPRR